VKQHREIVGEGDLARLGARDGLQHLICHIHNSWNGWA
jgi:hypothetical protein